MSKNVPCLICKNKIEVNEEKIIATVCKECQGSKDINKLLKSLDYKTVKDVLTVKQIQQLNDNTQIKLNKFGEIV